jgi:lipid-binding SYLF domain-containing protein
MKQILGAAVVLLAAGTVASAQLNPRDAERLDSAAQVLRETRASIPVTTWQRARCVAVIPNLKKAAFIVGGEYGKGAMSCRTGDGWSAPVFLQLAKGSWGFQAGAQEVDVVMLVMNESGVQKLMKNNVSLGVDASVAAGPVGRQAQAGTDATLTAEILAYSRATGLFAGINLSGGVLRPDEDANRDAYGADATPSRVLANRGLSAPTAATPFLQALGRDELTASVADRAPAETAAHAPAETPRASSPGPGALGPTTDSDLRAQVVALQQSVARMLADEPAAVGTSGTVGDGPMVMVNRDQLERLRSQIDALLAALNQR